MPTKLALLLSEIDAAFPNPNDPITFAATQNLSYLNACINESMRLMPIVRAGVPRVATRTTVLDGYEIPSGVRSPRGPSLIVLWKVGLMKKDSSNSLH
jgi:cytochrome P450